MKKPKFILSLGLTLLSSLLMILAFPEFNAFYFGFVALVPLFIVLELEKSLFKVFLFIETFVLIFYSYLIFWIEGFHPLALPGVLIYLLIIYPIPFFLYKIFKRSNQHSLANVFLLTCFLTLFETLRNVGFMKFPYGNIAYSQYEFLPFIQIVEIVGPLGISFFLYFFNGCVATFIIKAIINKNFSKKSIFHFVFNRVVFALIIFGAIYVYGIKKLHFYQAEEENLKLDKKATKITLGLVQPWFDYNQSWNEKTKKELYDKLINQTFKIAKEDIDLIIWPETAILDYYDYQVKNNLNSLSTAREFYDFFQAFGKQYKNTQFLVGSSDFEISTNEIAAKEDDFPTSAKDAKTGYYENTIKQYNSIFLINQNGEVIDKSGKVNLVGFAEHFPYTWLFRYIPLLEKSLDEAQASSFSPFPEIKTINFSKGDFGTLVCYDSVFPELSRLLVLKGAKFLVIITNDAWSYSTRSQIIHHSFSIFRAIENRRHVARVGNAGVTTIISPDGQAKDKTLAMFVEDSMVSSFFLPDKPVLTFYSLYGNAILYAFILLFMINYFGLMGLLFLPLKIIKTILALLKKNKFKNNSNT